MKFIKPLAATLIVGLSLNVAMAATSWCGYDATATIQEDSSDNNALKDNYSNASFTNRAKALYNAAKKQACGYKAGGTSTKLSTDLGTAAEACNSIQSTAKGNDKNIKEAKMNKGKGRTEACLKYYSYLSQENPTFLNDYADLDMKPSNIPARPFCDNGTNPNNKTDYTNDDTCKCIETFGYVNSDVGVNRKKMMGYAPYSWLSNADINIYKVTAKQEINNSARIVASGQTYSHFSHPGHENDPLFCCDKIGGTVDAAGKQCN